MNNNIDKHAYMQAAMNMMFIKMYENKGIKLFCGRAISFMIK